MMEATNAKQNGKGDHVSLLDVRRGSSIHMFLSIVKLMYPYTDVSCTQGEQGAYFWSQHSSHCRRGETEVSHHHIFSSRGCCFRCCDSCTIRVACIEKYVHRCTDRFDLYSTLTLLHRQEIPSLCILCTGCLLPYLDQHDGL